LSEELGVSRPTVREAMQALATMKILDVRRGSGVYVAPLDLADLLHPLRFAIELNEPTLDSLFEVRLVLEPLAAGLAAERATNEEIDRLKVCVERSARSRITLRRFAELDAELHRLIVEAARNGLLSNLIASLNLLSKQSRDRTVRQPGVPSATRRDHSAIVNAIADRNRDKAEAAMRHHIEQVRSAPRPRPVGHTP